MRYAELIKIFDEMSERKQRRPTPDQQAALERLRELDGERLELVADAVHRELQAGYSSIDLERHEMERRLRR